MATPLCFCSAAGFLRVQLEESKSFPWERVVETAGNGVFTEKGYTAATKHLQAKARKFIGAFTPCATKVDDAADLLMLPEGTEKKTGIVKMVGNASKKVKGKRSRDTRDMCEYSGELQQLARMILAWWVLGPSSKRGGQEPPTLADTFRGARLLFVGHIFYNGALH